MMFTTSNSNMLKEQMAGGRRGRVQTRRTDERQGKWQSGQRHIENLLCVFAVTKTQISVDQSHTQMFLQAGASTDVCNTFCRFKNCPQSAHDKTFPQQGR